MSTVVFHIILYSVLAVISVIDIVSLHIPDISIIILMVFFIVNDLISDISVIPEHLLFAFSVFIVLYLIRYFTHGLGLGDIKLLSVISYTAGFRAFTVSLFFACISGILTFAVFRIIRKELKKLPFSPFITLGLAVGTYTERFLV